MRYIGMQLLTWGTIAGAVGSALLLAALEGHVPRYGTALHPVVSLPSAPPQAGRPVVKPAASAPGRAASAASRSAP